jgi:hypothetical protein
MDLDEMHAKIRSVATLDADRLASLGRMLRRQEIEEGDAEDEYLA